MVNLFLKYDHTYPPCGGEYADTFQVKGEGQLIRKWKSRTEEKGPRALQYSHTSKRVETRQESKDEQAIGRVAKESNVYDEKGQLTRSS